MIRAIILILAFLLVSPGILLAEETQKEIISKVGIDQNLGKKIPLGLKFQDETGKTVRLGSFFKKDKPVIITPVYYECPMLCNLLLNGFVDTLGQLKFNVGKEFEVVTFSIDPGENHELASMKKDSYLKIYPREGAKGGWHFLTGTEENIQKLTKALGFRYVYDEKIDEYAHAASIQVLTPEGRIANYFSDVLFSPRDLRLALVEASNRKIASALDQFLLMCYHYNPLTGKYSFMITNILRFFGTLTALAIFSFIFISLKNDPDRSLKLKKARVNGRTL